jgi:ABC-type enterochelin transport system permease subunit
MGYLLGVTFEKPLVRNLAIAFVALVVAVALVGPYAWVGAVFVVPAAIFAALDD